MKTFFRLLIYLNIHHPFDILDLIGGAHFKPKLYGKSDFVKNATAQTNSKFPWIKPNRKGINALSSAVKELEAKGSHAGFSACELSDIPVIWELLVWSLLSQTDPERVSSRL